jgi:hypothetical protein
MHIYTLMHTHNNYTYLVVLKMGVGWVGGRRARSGESVRPFTLQTTFPSRELSDGRQTLAAAGLANAVIVQRYV